MAATVTPGNTPPDASLTTPVIAACAWAVDGNSNEIKTTRRGPEARRITWTIAILLNIQQWTPADGIGRTNREGRSDALARGAEVLLRRAG
ncbi:MAG TPA: hypothetical protein VHJ58_11345 [Vicinamibacterales bacterium]|nr:hypothetical protein [Vicinamibacterales bacterium]